MIVIASDHAGFELKQDVIKYLAAQHYEYLDLGCNNTDSVDYPDYAYKLAEYVTLEKANYGILICGTGIGMSIAVNRFNKIRAALCLNEEMARLAREHNNANVLVLGARITKKDQALECVKIFLDTLFQGGRHQNRINKLEI